ncbi:MAG: histidinol-phosphate transaminase [archaeon]|nr:histidinol-phosphate transaminase [archaeon]
MLTRDVMRSTVREFERYYNPKVGNAIRLDTNTNVFGSNPAAIEFLKRGIDGLDGYPNTYSDGLRSALADLYNLETENFVVGNGSDEMLDVCFKTFTEWKDTSTIPVPSYVLYNYFIAMNGGTTNFVDLTEDFQLDVDTMLKNKSKIILVSSPNNPTGNSFRQKDIEEILSRFNGIVIVDEAYAEYSDKSMAKRVNEFDNLIVLRTFSKVYAMAAMRVGYAISNLNIAGMMNCVKIPYSLNKLSEGAAIAAVKDQEFIRRSVNMVKEQRLYLSNDLKKLGFIPYPSDANFIMAKAPIDHTVLVNGLKKKNIIIRDFGDKRRTENCIRVTVGTREINKILLEKIAEVIEGC